MFSYSLLHRLEDVQVETLRWTVDEHTPECRYFWGDLQYTWHYCRVQLATNQTQLMFGFLQIKAVLGGAYKDAVTNYNTTDPKSSEVDAIQRTVSDIFVIHCIA